MAFFQNVMKICLSCKNGPIKNDTGRIKSMECIKCKDANNLKKK